MDHPPISSLDEMTMPQRAWSYEGGTRYRVYTKDGRENIVEAGSVAEALMASGLASDCPKVELYKMEYELLLQQDSMVHTKEGAHVSAIEWRRRLNPLLDIPTLSSLTEAAEKPIARQDYTSVDEEDRPAQSAAEGEVVESEEDIQQNTTAEPTPNENPAPES
jgi:hypothetical protein